MRKVSKFDIAELYDHEIAKIGPIWQKLMIDFSRKANNQKNLEELARRATEEFHKIGLLIDVNTMPCVVADDRGMTGPPEIIILGRTKGADEDKYGFDHELKMVEVRRSKERGEKFLGEKGK